MLQKTSYGWVIVWGSQEVRVSQEYLDLLGERLIDHPEALDAICELAERYRGTSRYARKLLD